MCDLVFLTRMLDERALLSLNRILDAHNLVFLTRILDVRHLVFLTRILDVSGQFPVHDCPFPCPCQRNRFYPVSLPFLLLIASVNEGWLQTVSLIVSNGPD